jgi:hypothetical protein
MIDQRLREGEYDQLVFLDDRQGALITMLDKRGTDEIAELAAYIAGPQGTMMTGAKHIIDGGMGA